MLTVVARLPLKNEPMNNTPQDTECSAYASPFEKGGLRGIYLRWRGLTTIANPPTPLLQRSVLPNKRLQEYLKIIKRLRTRQQ